MSDPLRITFDGRPVYLDEICPVPGPWERMADVMDANRALGHHWFSEGAMSFFHTVLSSGSLNRPRMGRFFFTSEAMDPDADDPVAQERRWTIRAVTDRGQVVTVGRFHRYETMFAAEEALEGLLSTLNREDAL